MGYGIEVSLAEIGCEGTDCVHLVVCMTSSVYFEKDENLEFHKIRGISWPAEGAASP